MKQLYEKLQCARYEFQVQQVVQWVGASQKRFDALVAIMLSNDEALAHRAAWALSHIGETQSQLAVAHFTTLMSCLQQPNMHNGIVRSMMRLFQFADIPEALHGEMMDICFRNIENLKEKPAIKAIALTILHNLSKQYPDILPEIKEIIQSSMELESPAFRARAKVFLK